MIISKPITISTWKHGLGSSEKAIQILKKNGYAIDAVEQGVRITESDPSVRTVGYGGYTDKEGFVTLDASIMDHKGNAGSVAFLENIKHPISVARKIMDNSNHVMLVGKGAESFAYKEGFKKDNIITNQSKKNWKNWLQNREDISTTQDNHDTIATLALDNHSNLAAACTTSGLAYKGHGRVGDSPIIGSGIFVDNEIGCAAATGSGEEIMKTVGSFLIVELMRQGFSPISACEQAIKRIIKKYSDVMFQVAYIAIRKDGSIGYASIKKDFYYVISTAVETKIISVTGQLE